MLSIFLIGDSIRMACQPVVGELLAGRALVGGPEQNCGDSRRVLANLETWLAGQRPDVVQVNCGLHDLKLLLPRRAWQVPLDEYARNVPLILARLRGLLPAARIIWASTTPVRDECYGPDRTEFIRRQADIEQYNGAASAAARAASIEINDLHAAVERVGRSRAVSDDGVHMTEAGNRALADAVARFVLG